MVWIKQQHPNPDIRFVFLPPRSRSPRAARLSTATGRPLAASPGPRARYRRRGLLSQSVLSSHFGSPPLQRPIHWGRIIRVRQVLSIMEPLVALVADDLTADVVLLDPGPVRGAAHHSPSGRARISPNTGAAVPSYP